MANENLKNALSQAGLTVEQFAHVIQVDPKSVQRWVTGQTIPYRRHRAAIIQALNLTEHELWPDLAADPAGGPDPEVRAGKAGEVTGAWGYANDQDAPDLITFMTQTTGPIDVLDCCCGIPITEQLTDTLMQQAEAGRTVRILTDGQAPHWEPLLNHPLIDLYLAEIPGEYWLIRTTGRMLLTINLEHQPASTPQPPLLEFQASGTDGLFTRLAEKFDELWALTREIEPDDKPGEPATGGQQSSEIRAGRSGAAARHWPGRTN